MHARIVVCASGAGSGFAALVEAARMGSLRAEIAGLISNRPQSGVLGRAKLLKIPYAVVAPSNFASRDLWDEAMVTQLKRWRADWVVLAGFLLLIGPRLLAAYPQRIVNCHPALLPKFGGPGMYGVKVHESVLRAGELETGITIHMIDGQYDRGHILAQKKVPILPGDTASTLEQRVKAEEARFYPEVLNDLVTRIS